MSLVEKFIEEEYTPGVWTKYKDAASRIDEIRKALNGQKTKDSFCQCLGCVKVAVREANEAILSLVYWEGLPVEEADFFRVAMIGERDFRIEFGPIPPQTDPCDEEILSGDDIENLFGTLD